MSETNRLDVYLVKNGLAESRERARALILEGLVSVNGRPVQKAAARVNSGDAVTLRGKMEFVSRGGYKLKRAIGCFSIDLRGKICMDVGASTGGFTDCMLQSGAARVYCVDVGHDQLAQSLRGDARVLNLERTNIRKLSREELPEAMDFASVDVSFISLELVLPIVYNLLNDAGEAVALVKPQFEAGRGNVGKRGVVRGKGAQIEVIERVAAAAAALGFAVRGLTFSPVKGPEGHIEYLLYLTKRAEPEGAAIHTAAVADAAHAALGKQAGATLLEGRSCDEGCSDSQSDEKGHPGRRHGDL